MIATSHTRDCSLAHILQMMSKTMYRLSKLRFHLRHQRTLKSTTLAWMINRWLVQPKCKAKVPRAAKSESKSKSKSTTRVKLTAPG